MDDFRQKEKEKFSQRWSKGDSFQVSA